MAPGSNLGGQVTLQCPLCATPMVVLAFLTDPSVVCRILSHLGLPTTPPTLAPARFPDEPLPREFQDFPSDLPNDDWPSASPDTSGRDPPSGE